VANSGSAGEMFPPWLPPVSKDLSSELPLRSSLRSSLHTKLRDSDPVSATVSFSGNSPKEQGSTNSEKSTGDSKTSSLDPRFSPDFPTWAEFFSEGG